MEDAAKIIRIELPGPPIPWATGRVMKGYTYSPKAKQKRACQRQIQEQYSDFPTQRPVFLEFYFYMPIPKSASKKKKKEILDSHHTNKPDTTNLQKFAEDCLTGIIFVDDKQVFQVFSKKIYSENPKTVIHIIQL